MSLLHCSSSSSRKILSGTNISIRSKTNSHYQSLKY